MIAHMLYYCTLIFSEVDNVHVQAPTRPRWMAEAPTWTADRRASSPGSPSSESFCRLQYVGIDPVSEPGEHQLMPRRPVDSTRADGPPRAAIANLSKNYFCPNPMSCSRSRSVSVTNKLIHAQSGTEREALARSLAPEAWFGGSPSRSQVKTCRSRCRIASRRYVVSHITQL